MFLCVSSIPSEWKIPLIVEVNLPENTFIYAFESFEK